MSSIQSRPLPLWVGRFFDPAFQNAPATLGAACPEGLFPNITNPGFCTNIPTDQQGRAAGIVTAAVATCVDCDAVAANQDARFGLQLTPDSSMQQRLINEVIAAAARTGRRANCRIVENTSPYVTGGPPAFMAYQGLCSIDGAEENTAAQLLLTMFAGPQVAAVVAANTPPASGSPAAGGGAGGGSSSTPPSTSAPVTSAGGPVVHDEVVVPDWLPDLSDSVTLPGGFSVPMPLLLGGGALALAFMFMGGKR